MTSELATNSLEATNSLRGYKVFLEADYENHTIPLERQIPQIHVFENIGAGVQVGFTLPREPVWIINSDLTLGSITLQPTNQQCVNMDQRRTLITFAGTPDVANSITITLPAGWEWVGTGLAAGLVSMTLPVNVSSAIEVNWAVSGTDKYAILNGSLAGYSFA